MAIAFPAGCARIAGTTCSGGPLEPTNEWYGVAKIAGIKLCQAYRKQYGCDFISAMPSNLHGPKDHFHPERSRVIPGMMRRFHEAVARVTGFRGEILWERTKPDGTMLKRMDTARINAMGWQPAIGFEQGLAEIYRWFLDQPALRG